MAGSAAAVRYSALGSLSFMWYRRLLCNISVQKLCNNWRNMPVRLCQEAVSMSYLQIQGSVTCPCEA